jgi:RNA polymerase sigma-70 factor (ECF subfamily)
VDKDGTAAVSDDDLAGRVAAGEIEAWRELMDAHLAAVTGYAWHMLGDRAEAEDVAQETFIRFMKKAPDWRPGNARLRTWLLRVAINLCLDRLRARRPRAELNVEFDPELEAEPGGVARIDDGIDHRRIVRRALRELPERQAGAISLVHFLGLSNAEAAETMSISVEALESLLARGRRTMRRKLEPLAQDLLEA